MSVMPDSWIKKMALTNNMISPFVQEKCTQGVLSYGVSSYGYDARVDSSFKVFTNVHSEIIDPKNFSSRNFIDKVGDTCIIPPNGFVLGKTIEYFRIPRDVIVICLGKSTYARCGIMINVTPIEPGWEGFVTLEFSNTTPLPVKIYAGEGACQFLFLKGESLCEKSYSDMAGRYMNQLDITLPFVE